MNATIMKGGVIMVDQTIITVFNSIYDSTRQKALIYITAKCNNPDDICDIFQETYTELFSVLSRRGVNYIKDQEAFVIKLAKQKIYRHYTLAQKLKIFVPMISASQVNEETIELSDIDTFDFTIEEHMVNRQLLLDINDFLKHKSPLINKIFYLYYSLDLTIPQIAKELGLTESNVKNKLYRTLSELRKHFSTEL